MADWPLAQGDGSHVAACTFTADSSYGAALTAGASNVKGAWVEGLAATPFDACGFLFQTSSSNSNANYLFDMGIGTAGNEIVVMPNFLISPPIASMAGSSAYFPVRIPKGSRISFRIQSGTAAATASAHALFVAAGFGQDPGFSRITDYGVLSSGATDSTSLNPGGTINTKGSWVTLSGNGASTPYPIKYMIVNVQTNNTAASAAAWKLDIGIGATPTIIVPDLIVRVNGTTDQVLHSTFSLPVRIPAGVALKARVMCSINDATDRILDEVSIFGMD